MPPLRGRHGRAKDCAPLRPDPGARRVRGPRERLPVCRAGCRQPSGSKVTRRAACLADSLPAGQTAGYDVMVFAGVQRFVHHRQREEVREALRTEHGVDISTGEVSILQRRFVLYLQRLHAARRDAIRQAFARDGGWPLHIEATGEDGRGTLLIAYAGWRRWVLGSWKIPTENADAILPCLRQVAAAFEPPVAVVRDLGRAMTPAVLAFVDELGGEIPVLACHQHFLADVGGDLLERPHAKIRELFRRFKVRPGLRTLARDLGRKLGEDVDRGRGAAGRGRLSAPAARRPACSRHAPACSRPPRPNRLRSAVRAGGAHPALAGQPVRRATRCPPPGSQDHRPQPANPRAGQDDPARAGPSGSA